MKIKSFVLVALAFAASPCHALDLHLGMNGDVSLGSGRVRLGVQVYKAGWSGTLRSSVRTDKANPSGILPDVQSGTAFFEIVDRYEKCAEGRTTLLARDDGSAGLSVDVSSLADLRTEGVVLAFDIKCAEARGLEWRLGADRKGQFPERFGAVTLAAAETESFSFTEPVTKKLVTFHFPDRMHVLVQDNRKWTNSFTVRFSSPVSRKTFAKGDRQSFRCEISHPDRVSVEVARPVTIALGPDWIAVDYRKDVLAGSALDFSGMGFCDAPAGKYGWLRAAGEDFEFEGRPGVGQRFYGVNLCFGANAPDPALATQVVTRIKRLGYNSLRLHHYEQPLLAGSKDGVTFNRTNLDRFDRLCALAIENGIYLTTDLYVSRRVPWKAIGFDRDGIVPMAQFKNLIACHEPAFENWKTFARNLLLHKNPYTGRRYVDEPGLPLIAFVNEGTLRTAWNDVRGLDPFRREWRDWLRGKRTKDPGFARNASEDAAKVDFRTDVAQLFMAEREIRLASRQRDFLRSLGCRALFTSQNCDDYRAMATARETYDYVDTHFYEDHPAFLGKRWSLPSKCGNGNPVLTKTKSLVESAFVRMAGKPFTITEWNFSGPGMYRGVGGIMTGALASLQEWDGLWRFAYASSDMCMRDGHGTPVYFDLACDPLAQASDRACICLYLRGDLSPLGDRLALAGGVEDAPTGGRPASAVPEWRDEVWNVQVARTTHDRAERYRTYPFDKVAGELPFAPRGCPALDFDRSRGTFAINTPLTAGGFAPAGALEAGAIRFDVGKVAATVWTSSLDGQPIRQSKRLLVTHLTDVQADGNVYADREKTILLKWGKGGTVVRNGRADVSIALEEPAAYEVWGLETSGRRLERIPAEARAGRLAFTARVDAAGGARMLYEVVKTDPVGRLAPSIGYFEPDALETADLPAMRAEIARTLGRCPAVFSEAVALAGRRSGRERDMVDCRLEIGRRLENYVRERADDGDPELALMAWQGARELRTLFGYFAAENRRDERRAGRLAPRVAKLTDFLTDGNGSDDCSEAFRRAFAFVKEQGGKPVVLKIPAGVWTVNPPQEDSSPKCVVFPSYRDYDESGEPCPLEKPRPWKDYGAGFHLTCHGLSNLTIEGDDGAEIRFADATRGGIGFFGCTEVLLRNVTIAYRDNPSTQGVVVSADAADAGFVFRRDPGYPDPDEPRFMKAHSRRFTMHRDDGLVGDAGTGRMGSVERLSDDTFRFRPPQHMKDAAVWRNRRPGERLSVIARYSETARGFPVSWKLCSFCGAEKVRIYDSPGQSFKITSSYAPWLLDCEVDVRPGSGDLVGSNGDGLIANGPIGPYVDGCTFCHMEDDGFNIGSEANVVESASPDRRTVTPPVDGAAFQVDGVTGRVKAVVRRDPRTGELTPLSAETVSKAMLGGGMPGKLDMAAWLASNSWNGVRGERKPDRMLRVPGTVGAVIRNTRLHDLRGMGIQVHCANMLVENVSVDHVTGPGMTIGPLFGWGMLFDVHNILVRDSLFADCETGLRVRVGAVQPGARVDQKMIQGVDLVGNVFRLSDGKAALQAKNAHDVRIEGARFRLDLKREASSTNAVAVTSGFADEVRMTVAPDGTEEITYAYRDGTPVTQVVVHIAPGVVPEEKRYWLSARMAKGWWLEKASFPEYELPLVRGQDPKDDCVIVGSSRGGYWTDPSSKVVGWRAFCTHPGRAAAQFAAAWDDRSGVYFGTEDVNGCCKEWGFERMASSLRFVQKETVWTSGEYVRTYPVVIRSVRSAETPLAWQDFADIYRTWTRRQSWSRTSYQKRPDIPAWMKDAPVFTRFSRQWLERPEDIRRFVAWWKREIGEMPVVAALWGWEKHGTWWGPDYFPCHPSDAAFSEIVRILGDNSFHSFVWPSGYNWCEAVGGRGDGTYELDFRERWIRPNECHLVVRPDGSQFSQRAYWLDNGALTTLCGGDPWSQTWWNGLTAEMGRRGADIVQGDQMVGGRIRPCWSARHGHPVGEGTWMWKAFRRQLESMRTALRAVRPDGMISVEEMNESYNDLVCIQDYRDLETSGDRFASVFGYLYHGFVPTFQSNVHRDEFFSLAHMAVDGQMPFFRPDFDELAETRPALQDGGFENLVDSVRGPTGWDRLIPNRLLEGVDARTPLWNFSGHNNMGWVGYAVTLDADVKHSGAVSLKFDPPAAGGRDNGAPMQVSQTVEGLPPGDYVVTAWVRSDDPSAPAGELKCGSPAEGEACAIPFPAATEWTKVSATVAVKGDLRLIVWAPPGARFHLDDVTLARPDGTEIRVSGDSPYVAFMKKWISLYRGEGRSFLADGFQVRPPELACARIRIAAREVPAVCHAAYENSKGERALVLANATREAQKVSCRWGNGRLDLTISPRDIRLVR